MSAPITYAVLKDKERRLHEDWEGEDWLRNLGLRVHRVISWVGCAEAVERTPDQKANPDSQFIMLWIAFNSAYAVNIANESEESTVNASERGQLKELLHKLVGLDKDERIYKVLKESLSDAIIRLVKNPYTHDGFWKSVNNPQHPRAQDWEKNAKYQQRKVNTAFNEPQRNISALAQALETHGFAVYSEQTEEVLSVVFDRLYELRNEILHGSATWRSSVNRKQVGDGAKIVSYLIPLFVDMMMDHPDVEWGNSPYPLVNPDAFTKP